MGRPKKSTVTLDREERQPVREIVKQIDDSIEQDERLLLTKLKQKYQGEEIRERIPGRKVRGQKDVWTWRDILERFKDDYTAIIPDETIPLTWNGVKIQLISGIETHLPKPFYELWKAHKAALRPGKVPPGIVVEYGAGALPPEE